MTLKNSKNVGFNQLELTWNLLCIHKQHSTLSPRELLELDRVKSRPPSWLFGLARTSLKLSRSEHTYAKFLTCSWADIVDIIYDQAVRNRIIRRESWYQKPESRGVSSQIDRAHNQLPCTLHTAQKRVLHAKKVCKLDEPILVLGDDDHIGLELVKAGFIDVCSVDIDHAVCQRLREESSNLGLTLKVLQHDISKPSPKEYLREYSLVFLDPMYSLDGIEMFLKAAFEFSTHSKKTHFFLSIHLLSLLRAGLDSFPDFLSERDLSTVDFFPGFNTYPVPKQVGFVVKIFNRLLVKTSLLSSFDYMFKYFFSDAILLKKTDSTKNTLAPLA